MICASRLVLLSVLGAAMAVAVVPAAGLAIPAADGDKVAADEPALTFEIYKDKADEFRWRLKAANGKILATSGEGYKANADCKKGVENIKAEAAGKLTFEVYEDKAKEHRWRLKSSNGQVVGTSSEGYTAKADCEKAIESIKKNAAKAEVNEADK